MDGFLAPLRARLGPAGTAGLVAALLLVLGAAAPADATACAGAGARPGEASSTVVRHATLCLLNGERARRGLRRLRHEPRLALAGRRHARDMVRSRYFAHDSLAGTSFVARIRRTGYTTGVRWRLAENLAWGGGASATPGVIVASWMRSPGHRANVLGAYREVGIGLAWGAPVPGRPGAATYAAEFGARR
jgi:uncharacterized protein YkwD